MFSTAHFSATSCTTCAHTDRANARSACSEFARALMRPMSPSRLRQPASIVACMWHLRDKGKYTRHTPLVRMSCGDHPLSCHSRIRTHILEESCACPSLPRSVAPSSYACDGTGTAVTALVNLHARNERTGTHGTGCACRCFREPVVLRRSAASTRPSTAQFEGSRVCRHLIWSKVLRTLPWWLKSTLRAAAGIVGRDAEPRV